MGTEYYEKRLMVEESISYNIGQGVERISREKDKLEFAHAIYQKARLAHKMQFNEDYRPLESMWRQVVKVRQNEKFEFSKWKESWYQDLNRFQGRIFRLYITAVLLAAAMALLLNWLFR